MSQEKQLPRFGLRDKVAYMFGDFGNDFTFILASAFLMKFYTDVMKVSPLLVGLMMMLARIVDAFTDVTMGQICDRSASTKKGKFAPWILRMCGPVAVASFLMYANWFSAASMGFKIFWMFFTYLLWGSVFYTSINIPYGSMASAISPEAKDRTQLSSWRTIGATLAGVAIGVVLPLVVYYKDQSGKTLLSGESMMWAALVCSICAVICYLICYSLTIERVKINRIGDRFDLIALIKFLVTNKALIGLILTSILALLSQLTVGSMNQYLYTDYFSNAKALSSFSLISSVIMLGEAMILPSLAARYGKKELGVLGCLIGSIAMLIAFFLKTESLVTWMILSFISYAGLGLFGVMCWAMITDVIDDTEVRTGMRSDGTIYATYSFARKLGQAASSGLSGALLALIGYEGGKEISNAVREGIYNISCLIPAVGILLMALVFWFLYPLKKSRVDQNVALLKAKREESEGH